MIGYFTTYGVWWIAAVTLAALAIGTGLRLAAVARSTSDVARARLNSLATWWVLTILVIAATLSGLLALVILFAAISALSWRELVRLLPGIAVNRPLVAMGYLLIPANYLWIGLGWTEVFWVFLPLTSLGLCCLLLTLQGQTTGFTRDAAQACWGLLVTTYCPAHAVLLCTMPPGSNPVAGVMGYFLLLMILTQINDIAQALIGRRIGRLKIAPQISPNKTWEGFLGGLVTTLLLSIVLSRWLTPFHAAEALLGGAVIAVAGFFGDLSLSAVKRDAGVKDSGRLLPGQGGILDRVDSLTFSAPAFYYFVRGFLAGAQNFAS